MRMDVMRYAQILSHRQKVLVPGVLHLVLSIEIVSISHTIMTMGKISPHSSTLRPRLVPEGPRKLL